MNNFFLYFKNHSYAFLIIKYWNTAIARWYYYKCIKVKHTTSETLWVLLWYRVSAYAAISVEKWSLYITIQPLQIVVSLILNESTSWLPSPWKFLITLKAPDPKSNVSVLVDYYYLTTWFASFANSLLLFSESESGEKSPSGSVSSQSERKSNGISSVSPSKVTYWKSSYSFCLVILSENEFFIFFRIYFAEK